MPKKWVAVNEAGRRVGQDHPAAELSNHEVDLLIEMHDEFPVGHPEHWGYRRLARVFELSKSQVRRICKLVNRSQTPSRHKTILN